MAIFTIDVPSNDNLRRTQDTVIPFLLNHSRIRGRIAKMGPVIDEILNRHRYPAAVSHLLGEALLVAGLLATLLEPGGKITIQAKGMGPINFMVVDGDPEGRLRGYVNIIKGFDFRKIRADAALSKLLGNGHLAITIDHATLNQRYQGIVAIGNGSFAECIEQYFSSSEHLDAKLRLLVGKVHTVVDIGQDKKKDKPHWYAGGILLQREPDSGNDPEHQVKLDNKWEEAKIFVDSITDKELLEPTLNSDQLLFRLFHEDGVWVYDPAPLNAECSCSRKKIEDFLKRLPDDDIDHMKQDKKITVTCEFCRKTEIFTEPDIVVLRQDS